MHPSSRTHGIVLAAAATLAVAVPAIAHRVLHGRIDDRLEPALSEALGTGVSIGSVEASLTGSVRVEDVRIGRVLEARAIEASVGLGRLLQGDLRADELRVLSPQLRVHVDSHGRTNLERLARHWSERKRSAGSAPASRRDHGLRRIVVSEGDLVVHIGRNGSLRLRDVALHPRAGGVRMTVGGATVDLHAGTHALVGGFDRLAGDLTLPAMHFDRLVAVGGALTLSTDGQAPVRFERAMALRDRPDGDRFAAAVERSGSSGRIIVTAPSWSHNRVVRIEAHSMSLSPLAPYLPAGFALGDSSATGSAVLYRSTDGLEVGLDASLRGVAIDDRRIAARRVEGDVDLTARLRKHSDELEIVSLEARRGAIDVALSGRLTLGSGVPERGSLRVALARTSCADALASLPQATRDRLAGMRLSGTIAASAEVDFTRADDRATRLDVDLDVGGCKVLGDAVDADPHDLMRPFEHTFPDGSRGRVGFDEGTGNEDGSYATLRSLPSFVPAAWVAAEDARFFRHNGFDPQQIERSLGINLREGQLVRGGSTISQQLVKNVFLSRERNLARKLQEAVLTWRLEAVLDKRLILERYLNLIELGPGVFGVARAARYWFDKDAQDLTVAETAFLAAMTPAPTTMSRRVLAGAGIDPESASRVRIVLKHMRASGAISEAQYDRARRANLQVSPALARL